MTTLKRKENIQKNNGAYSYIQEANIVPVSSDKVPRQGLSCLIVADVADGGGHIHQTDLVRVQGVLQVSVRQTRVN